MSRFYFKKKIEISEMEVNNNVTNLLAETVNAKKTVEQILSDMFAAKTKIQEIRKEMINLEEEQDNKVVRSVETKSIGTQSDESTLNLSAVGRVFTWPNLTGTEKLEENLDMKCKATGKVVLSESYASTFKHSLEKLEEYRYMWIFYPCITSLLSQITKKVPPAKLKKLQAGVFTTRTNDRLCPIDMKLVKIVKMEPCCIYFEGPEMPNDVQIFDLIPYVPECHSLQQFQTLQEDCKIEKKEKRFHQDVKNFPRPSEEPPMTPIKFAKPEKVQKIPVTDDILNKPCSFSPNPFFSSGKVKTIDKEKKTKLSEDSAEEEAAKMEVNGIKADKRMKAPASCSVPENSLMCSIKFSKAGLTIADDQIDTVTSTSNECNDEEHSIRKTLRKGKKKHKRKKELLNAEKKRKYFCSICKKGFREMAHLEQHVRIHKTNHDNKCPCCKRIFIRRQAMICHLRFCKKILYKGISATQNGSSFNKKTKFVDSAKSATSSFKKRIKYKCPFCEKKLYEFNMKVHIRTHTGEKPFPCSSCNKFFMTQGHLTLHTRSKHRNSEASRRYECDLCNKTFNSKLELDRHMRHCDQMEQEEIKPEFCCICSKTFEKNENISRHVRSHLRESAA